MVNKENMKKWIEALRSGEYVQIQGQLRDSTHANAMCCLGVACDISDVGHWEDDAYVDTSAVEYAELPPAVQYWLGVDSPAVEVSVDNFATAIQLNDIYQWDFLAIADALEKTYLAEAVNA